jgi:hypothetical protein
MKNKAIIILIIVVAGFLAALYLMGYLPFGNQPEDLNNEDFSIKSDDESAELFIPKGALPDNVDLNDISITKVSNSQTENGTWVVYELEPDGLVFTEEVLFNVTLESATDALRLVLISNDAGIELVNNTFTEVEMENQSQLVSVPLTHFSDLYVGYVNHAIRIRLDAPKSRVAYDMFVEPIGDTVDTTASFTLEKRKILDDNTVFGHGILEFELLEPYVIYKGTWTSSADEVSKFIPDGEFSGKPSSTKVALGQTNTVQDDTFKGDKLGIGHLTYQVDVTFSFKYSHYNSERDYVEGKADVSGTYRNQRYRIRHYLWIEVYEPRLIVQGIYTTQYQNNPEIHMVLKIEGPANATGFVTLTGSNMEPMIQPVLIGPDGSTRNTFIHPFSGEITVFVKVGDLNATRKHMID